MKIFFYTFAFIALLAPSLSPADELSTVIDKIQKNYNQTSTLKAKFTQESHLKSLNRTHLLRGDVAFKKPGKMSWIYNNGQKIISDGANLWIYQPREKQVIQTRVSSAGGKTPADFLIGVGNINENFSAKLLKSKNNLHTLELTPKEHNSFSKIVISVDNENFQIQESSIYDLFGNVTKIKFSAITINEELPPQLFDFKAPKGVEIIKQ